MEIVVATHAGVTTEEFDKAVKDWIGRAKDARWKRPYTELVYQPMLEVMRYLGRQRFKTYIVTGGTPTVLCVHSRSRPTASHRSRSSGRRKTKLAPTKDGNVIVPIRRLLLNNNNAGKAEDIALYDRAGARSRRSATRPAINRCSSTPRPVAARLGMLVLHDDAEREYAYGPAQGPAGHEGRRVHTALLDEATKRGWAIISMKDDWKRIFDF